MSVLAKKLRSLATACLRRDEASASVEFALCVPLLFFVFASAMDSGLAMLRATLLERAVDMTMRELRLGHFSAPTHELLRTEICEHGIFLSDCQQALAIEITAIDRDSWAMPQGAAQCVNRREDIAPVTELTTGQQNAIMLVRVCLVQDALFPYTGVGLRMTANGDGYRLVATSTFVNEPG